MVAFTAYFVKVVVISLILYSYYHFLLRNRLMHSWNRFFLLAIFVAGIGIPFIKLPDLFLPVRSFQSVLPVELTTEGADISFTVTGGIQKVIQPKTLLVFAYLAVCLLFAFSLIASLSRLAWWIAKYTPKSQRNGVVILTAPVKRTPFSFFRYIFWNSKIDIDSISGSQILQHELVHVRQLHSLDRLFVNTVMIVFWINPVFWLVRKELFLVHEFIADEHSIENKDPDEFARMLLTAAFPIQYKTVTSHFFTSPIKRRLHMLINQQKTRFGSLTRWLVLPLLLFVIAAFSLRDKPMLKNQLSQAAHVNDHYSYNSTQGVVLQDTVRASFPGGESAWLKYITTQVNKNIDSLQEAGKAGTTAVTFVIRENGTLSDFKVTKMEGTLLARILVEALQNGPQWIPATINGKKVSSVHKQPLTFQIQEED
ncbi:MAG: energy transducer TonB [Chitinophagaceae bacterium]|nr:energy transducer TonB [Chitinophagaceae bacterium]